METRGEECFQNISIHALREEGDADADLADFIFLDISIHALREEGDCWGCTPPMTARLFLSTPSVRRATSTLAHGSPYIQHFSPRPP